MSRPQISYPTPIEQPQVAGPSREPMDPRRRTSNSGSSTSTAHPQGPRRVESNSSYGGSQSKASGGQRNVVANIESATVSRHIESCVTRLLLATRQLLEGLTRWSKGAMREDAVSDIYVRLGDDFSQCVEAFHGVGISMSELASVPQELRVQLEGCLSEEPSEEVMEQYNPQVRGIIIRLLTGLKEKQAIFRELQRRSKAAPAPGSLPAKSLAQQRATALPTRPNQPPPADAFRPPRMRVPESSSNGSMGRRTPSPSPEPPRKSSSSGEIVRHTLTDPPVNRERSPSPQPPFAQPSAPVPQISSPQPQTLAPQPPKKTATADMAFLRHSNRDSDGNPRPESRFSLDSEVTHSPIKSPRRPPPVEQTRSPVTPPAPTPPPLPTLTLPELEPSPTESPEAIASLAALQRSDALERRASKRFSSYTFNKMLPGAGPASPQRPMRRASRTVVPPLPTLPPTFGTGEIGFLVEEAEGETTPPLPERRRPIDAKPSPPLETEPPATPPRRPRLAPSPLGAPETLPANTQAQAVPALAPTPPLPTPGPVPIFLQLGRQIKKAIVEPGLQLSSLRILFMEKFDYDPGMETFPDVYIRDPKTGVQYELEDMEDIKEGTMLSLNIEPLDQVKQHFDSTISTLLQELKEMKTSMAQSRRLSMSPSQPFLAPVTVPPAPVSRPSDEHFDAVARKVAAVPPSAPGSPNPAEPREVVDPVERTEQVSIDLRTQFDEVQNLRRDLGVMRQIYVDFVNQTKDTFQTLRSQTQSVREVAMTKLTGNRALVDADKAKLEANSQSAVQLVEDILDTVDACREDVVKRSVMPRLGNLHTMKSDLEKAKASVDQLLGQIATSTPIWKQTWNTELKTVLEEQHVLAHQEKLAADLKGDITGAADVFETISQYVAQKQQVPGRGGLRAYRPPTPTEEGGVSHLMMEIRAKEMDPNRRLRAIEQQQKAREKELASKTDEFTDELSGFVQGKKLKKTGGTEEAERLRQRRQEVTLRKMMQSEGGGPASPGGGSVGILTPMTTGTSVLSPTPTGGSTASVASSASAASATPVGSPSPAVPAAVVDEKSTSNSE